MQANELLEPIAPQVPRVPAALTDEPVEPLPGGLVARDEAIDVRRSSSLRPVPAGYGAADESRPSRNGVVVQPVGGGAAQSVAFQPTVVTPDAVGLDLPVATVGSRGIAWLIDASALVLGLLLVGVLTAVLGGGGFVEGWAAIAVLTILGFAWQLGYPVGFEVALRGRTPGKAAMGLRVVTVEGAPIGFRHAAIRAVLGLFELLPTLGAPAVVTSLASRRGQRLGDLVAGTVVIRERRVGGAPQAASFVPPSGLEAYTARLDVSTVDAATYGLIRDTLLRAPQLPVHVRNRLTARIATHVAASVSPPPPAGVPAEPWLWCVAAAVQHRRRPLAPAGPASPNWPRDAAEDASGLPGHEPGSDSVARPDASGRDQAEGGAPGPGFRPPA